MINLNNSFEEHRIIDNRTFLLGLDKLYRDAMMQQERGELLRCARQVAAVLQVAPADVPVEGYYAEDQQLTEYFRLMRALQEVSEERSPVVASLPEFQRLWDVTSAPLYGKPIPGRNLLPSGLDALTQALSTTIMHEWNVQRLTDAAYKAAEEMDDFSLVGLAARVRDAVVLTAMRESVVLYAAIAGGAPAVSQRPKYIWNVDKELVEQARRFINAFHMLFGEQLPPPEPAQAEHYWHACMNNEISGRCVRLGYNNAVSPMLQYHWAICRGSDGTLGVQEFWHPDVWTTERYRLAISYDERCLNL
jgi:hypothetical protein